MAKPTCAQMAPASKDHSGTFQILYFASASSHTGLQGERLPAPMPLGKLFSELDARYPGMRAKVLDSCLVTINLEYVDVPPAPDGEGAAGSDVTIQAGDEVAVIPPVSSG